MMASFVVLLHLPRVIAAPDQHVEWIMLGVSSTLTGAAWLVRKYADLNEDRPDSDRCRPSWCRIGAVRRRAGGRDRVIRAARRHGLRRTRRAVRDARSPRCARQLERREAEIVFDPNTESIGIVVRKPGAR